MEPGIYMEHKVFAKHSIKHIGFPGTHILIHIHIQFFYVLSYEKFCFFISSGIAKTYFF